MESDRDGAAEAQRTIDRAQQRAARFDPTRWVVLGYGVIFAGVCLLWSYGLILLESLIAIPVVIVYSRWIVPLIERRAGVEVEKRMNRWPHMMGWIVVGLVSLGLGVVGARFTDAAAGRWWVGIACAFAILAVFSGFAHVSRRTLRRRP